MNRDSIVVRAGLVALVTSLVLSGCASNVQESDSARAPAAQKAPEPPSLHTTPNNDPLTPARSADDTRADSPSLLPGWDAETMTDLRSALDGQCALRRTPRGWSALCTEIGALSRSEPSALRAWIARRFVAQPLRADDGTTAGLVTGYHEPEVQGSRRRSDRFQVPLYRPPEKTHPAARASRAEIERRQLLAGSELVWLRDPVDAFFLHVQGSGRIRLDDGTMMRVGYAGNNGHRYRAIGAVLVARGALAPKDVDAHKIKAWLRANPDAAVEVMRANPRYVFFRELENVAQALGPPGALGVPLTPLRSIAVDPARVPAGALMWLDTTNPMDGSRLQRLVVAQDTGAAIVGPVRADLFWGTGATAELAAGLMKHPGRLWVLTPIPPDR